MKFAVRAAVVLMALTVSSFAAITMTSPANGASTISPVHVMAQANPNGAAPIAQIQVYLDGQVAYQAKSNTVDTYINAAAGPHTIVVKAWDSAGGQMTQQSVVNGTGTGIFVGTPGPGATVNGATQVTASATSAASITAMQVYDNGTSIYQTQGGSINTSVNLAPGGHYLVINAWDASGAVYTFPLNLSAPAQAIAQATAPVTAASQVEIPSNATTIANIDQLPNWESCSACAGIGGNGPQDPYSMTQGVCESGDGWSVSNVLAWRHGAIRRCAVVEPACTESQCQPFCVRPLLLGFESGGGAGTRVRCEPVGWRDEVHFRDRMRRAH